MKTKICTKCGKRKSLNKFAKCKKNKSGLAAFCLDCAAGMTRAYRQTHLEVIRANEHSYRQNNLEAVRARDRKRGAIRSLDPKYKAWRKNYLKTYEREPLTEAELVKRRARNRAYYKKHQNVFVSYSRAYRLNNLEKVRIRDKKRNKIRGPKIRAKGRSWLDSFKEKPCVNCGGTFHPYVMDFHHVRGKKFRSISKMFNYSKERILAEIVKCDLLCVNCHRIRTKNNRGKTKNLRMQRYRDKINVLKNKPCVDCGNIFSPRAMDFDHVRGEKIATIAQMWSWPWDQVLLELEKCELVCANCHRVRTHNRNKQRIQLKTEKAA